MNPLRKVIHLAMEASGLDARIDADAVNAWIERRRQNLHSVLSVEAGNAWLLNALREGRPFAAGKIGSSECWASCWHLRLHRFYKYTWRSPSFGELDLAEQSGVFPKTQPCFQTFVQAFLEGIAELDLAAVWFNPGEHQILSSKAPGARRCEIQSLEPWFSSFEPWTSALAGKRVLVVHPFDETIHSQYGRRKEIWRARPELLPEFSLQTLKSPYGFSKNGFTDWAGMLDWMKEEMRRMDRGKGFDVALIGCGAAGIPLAAHAKIMGKAAIHLGGPLQLLFGIRGRRWDQRPEFQPLFNASWCRPAEHETPPEFSRVDHGGYW